MKLYQSMFVALVVISVIGDVSHFVHNMAASPGSELSRNSFSLISGSDAIIGALARAIGRAVARRAAAGHRKNRRPSNRGKHEKGDSRRQRDQNRSDGQKGGKGGKGGNKG
ncbi:hypothetical protein LOTGIDRAFT_232070 [Lottia gigantea]|uniref:Uncharacterized protein n=1 Tax=Lottia gigantea TaxID=225164 RepID=V3ZV81_LOTGI|nr:hypothetical protein LOTGIDRAFT_232070 [Lottia gigantea]ESO95388.1 hypothetical protein LOTGIDRAFT_232070 [Lottia gigantea]